MTVPPISAGICNVRGVVHVRVSHLLDWLEDVADANPDVDWIVSEIRDEVEKLQRVPA